MSGYTSMEAAVGSATPHKKKLNWVVFTPVAFAPIIPLTRVLLTRYGYSHAVVRRATLGMIGLAMVHGMAIMSTVDYL